MSHTSRLPQLSAAGHYVMVEPLLWSPPQPLTGGAVEFQNPARDSAIAARRWHVAALLWSKLGSSRPISKNQLNPKNPSRRFTKVGGDMATESRYRFSGRALVAAHRLSRFLGIELSGDLARPNQVTEQHRQMPPLAGHVGFSIRANRRRSSVERRSACTAELESRRILRAALDAPVLQRRTATATEPGGLGIL